MPRILVVDDHPVVREGIGRVLSAALPKLTLGGAEGPDDTLVSMRKGPWDLVILDLALGAADGTAVLRRLRESYPAVPVLIISMYPAEQFARRSVAAGAAGYVSKDSAPQELVRAVRLTLAGGQYRPAGFDAPDRPERMPHELLSDREYQVLRMIGQGRTVSQIAVELSLSVKTVSTYRARILEKMRMRTNAELMRYVIAHQLLPF
jgi:two-component system, NarL family, invasion response regulator UvrY